jgi:4-amino-4-deoxy-L-arabinose transferase-like glycosyltransferase
MWKEKKNLFINLLKLIITAVVLYFIFKKIPAREILLSLSSGKIYPLIIAFIFGLLFSFFKILKWHLLLKTLYTESSFLKSMESYFIGMSIGIITPGRLGEVARIGNIPKEKKLEGTMLVVWDKIFDVLAVLILAIFGFYFFFGLFFAILTGIIILMGILLFLNPKILKRIKRRFPKFAYIDIKALGINFILSLISYFTVIIEVYFITNAFNNFSFINSLIGYPIVMLANLLPITIGGLGVREGASIYFLGKLSLPSVSAFNSAFLLFLINTALPAIIGLSYLNKGLKNSKLLIVFITFIGAILRISKISERSIWLDEAITAQVSMSGILGIILNRSQTGIHPPLYFILIYFWTKIFGDSEFSLRFPSFIFGTLSIFLIYKLVKKIYDKETALISSILYSLSPFFIYFSQEARMYPLLIFLGLLSLTYVYDLSIEFNRKNLLKLLIVNSLLLYTHFFSTLLIISENIFIILLNRKNIENIKRWLLIQIINLLIFSPWIYVILTRNTPEIYQGAQPLSLYSISVSFYQIFFGFVRNFLERRGLIPIFLVLFLFFITLGILPPYKDKKGLFLNILYFFVPFLSLIIISSFGKSFYSSRYLSAFAPGILILMARGIKKIKLYPLINISLIFLVLIYSILNTSYYLRLNTLNRPWREVVEYIHKNAQEDHIVLISEAYYYRPFEYYNRGKISYIPVNPDFFYPEKLEKEMSNSKRVFLILSDENQRTLKIKNWLDSTYKYKEKKEFYKLKIHIYES